MATDYKSPLPGLLDYIVPDYIEKQAISGFSRDPNPMNAQGQPLYGGFTPNIDPNNPQGLSNIETLFGTAYMPQSLTYKSGGPTNKQLIDASILRAGLELGRGRMPGESFGGALQRGAEAMSIPGKTLADYQAAQAAARAKGMQPQVTINAPKMLGFRKVGNTLYKINEDFRNIVKDLTGKGFFDTEAAAIAAITNNAIGIESQEGKGIDNAILKSAKSLFDKTSAKVPVSKVPGQDDDRFSNFEEKE
tara:strand:- start:3060 stop:3803 length:744 start_codon:yes stop_codon:yes gene_type:complete